MVDVSFAGTGSIRIKSEDGISIDITDFPDDADPLTVDEIEVLGSGFSLDRELIAWRKPAAYVVSVAVLANSSNDESLRRILETVHCNSENTDIDDLSEHMITLTVMIGYGKDGVVYHEFGNGYMKSGQTGVSVDTDGRMKSNRYTFIFGTYTTYK